MPHLEICLNKGSITVYIANKSYANSIVENVYLKNGLNVHRGNITHAAVATTLGYNHLSTI